MADATDDLVDYEDYDQVEEEEKADGGKAAAQSIHNASFKEMLLKAELLKAITDCGFENPSAVQAECIPQAMLGMDVICQAKAGQGKTAVFVLAVLQQLEITDANENDLLVVVIAPTRELAFQVQKEFDRFTRYLEKVRTRVIYGGIPIKDHIQMLADEPPNVIVGTPGRVKALCQSGDMKADKVKHFVLDECDSVLDQLDMRRDVQSIFMACPKEKQVMMFSATFSDETREVCKKMMQDPLEVFIDETALTLHGLQQYYVTLEEKNKTRKLTDLLDDLEFNQVVIFVKTPKRAEALTKILTENSFPCMCIHGGMKQPDRIQRFRDFKDFKKRILVGTDLIGRGIDIERINIVINYDMPDGAQIRGEKPSDTAAGGAPPKAGADQYLHRVGRAGRFNTKGLAISFIATGSTDSELLNQIQSRFETEIPELPDTIDQSSYMSA